MHTPPPMLHLDDDCIVVIKPAGMLSVPGRGEALHDCAAERVRSRFADALVVHRLDMATSGLLLFARGAEAQRRLSRDFAERRVEKRYVAVVHGLLERDAGCIELPLAADWPNRPRQRVDRAGRPALTLYRVMERDDTTRTTRVELQPITGRTHQLRVHLLALGHPIVGDALYAAATPAVDAAADAVAPRATSRLHLHGSALDFMQPRNGLPLQFVDAAPF